MQFSKIASVAILFVLSFLGLAMASPVARSTSTDALAVITELKANIASDLASIGELQHMHETLGYVLILASQV
jgi:hypothetical protein